MRKVLYLILLLALILHAGGLILIYKIKQDVIRFEMARTIGQKQSGFQKLVITKSEFRKSRIHSHELFFNGELYDIKSELFSANKVVLLVIRDKNEKNILDKIRDLTHNTKSRHNELPGQLVTLLIHSFICPVTENKFILNEAEHSSYYPFSESLISFLVEIASPPPEKV